MKPEPSLTYSMSDALRFDCIASLLYASPLQDTRHTWVYEHPGDAHSIISKEAATTCVVN